MKKRKIVQQNNRKTDEPLDFDELDVVGSYGYTGDVKIELQNDSTQNVITLAEGHNFGTQRLCEYITTCLIGRPNVAKMPGSVQPCKRYGEQLENVFERGPRYLEDETNPLSIETDEYTDIEGNTWSYSKYTLKFSIQGQLLAGISQLSGVRLYSYDWEDMYAEIDFGIGNELDISKIKNSTLIIKWTLRVSTLKESA